MVYRYLKMCVLSLCVAVLCGGRAFGVEFWCQCCCKNIKDENWGKHVHESQGHGTAFGSLTIRCTPCNCRLGIRKPSNRIGKRVIQMTSRVWNIIFIVQRATGKSTRTVGLFICGMNTRFRRLCVSLRIYKTERIWSQILRSRVGRFGKNSKPKVRLIVTMVLWRTAVFMPAVPVGNKKQEI